MLSRLRQLQVGSRVRVSWEGGESAVGRVVEPVSILLCVRDIGVRIEYSLDQGLIVCNERLGFDRTARRVLSRAVQNGHESAAARRAPLATIIGHLGGSE